jgi:hypothetical protein
MLTSFAVAFPFVVLAVFVWLLVVHTEKLYAPSQYTPDTTIAAFAEATRRQTRDAQLVAQSAISAAVAPAIVARSNGADLNEVREQIAERLDQAVEDASVKLARSLLIEGADTVSIPVSRETTVQDLLDSAYFALTPAVGPYTYGIDWMLVRSDHELLENIGSKWAEGNGMPDDYRPLREVGIEPGATLTAIRRGHRRFRRPPVTGEEAQGKPTS